MGRILGFFKLLLLGVFLILISCPLTLEDNLSETIASDVHEATASEYTLTIETPESGIINLSGSLTVKDGISQQLVANPYQTHAFIRWEKVSGPGSAVFESAESAETSFYITGGDVEIRAVFEERPRVRYSTPTGNVVGIDATILIKFSKEMDLQTINENTVNLKIFDLLDDSVSELVSCSIDYNNKTVILKPNSDMEAFRYFSINVSKDVKDSDGISMLEDYISAQRFFTCGTGDTDPPVQGEFVLNSGDVWTSSVNVTLSDIYARDPNEGFVARMYMKNESGGTWSVPVAFNETASWILSGPDGLKSVFMKFEDASGNPSEIYGVDVTNPHHEIADLITAQITLDTTAPVFENVLSSGESGIAMAVTDDGNSIPKADMYTASQDVNLFMNASDIGIGTSGSNGEEILQMLLGQNISFTQGEWNGTGYDTPEWEDFIGEDTARPFKVDPNDGTKVVLVKFRDSLGNESGKTYDYVKLDQTPPTGTITIENGAGYTKEQDVTLNISAVDNGVGTVSMMWISNSSDFPVGGSWESYSTTKAAWHIDNLTEGVKTVYIKFKDSLGNEMDTVDAFSDTIIVDTTPPVSNSISINGGASQTVSNLVDLTILANDSSSGVVEMMISNSSDFTVGTSSWVSYNTTYKNWDITDGNSGNKEDKSVYIKYKDSAGNIMLSNYGSDSIYVDIPPGIFNINSGDDYTNSTTVNINMYQSSPSGTYKIANTEADLDTASPIAYGSDKAKTVNFVLTTTQGMKTVWVRFIAAETITISHTIELDTIVPTAGDGSFSLSGTADDDSATRYSYVTLNSNVTDANDLTMRFKNESGGTWSGWYPYNSVKSYWYLNNYNTDGKKTVYVEYKDSAGNVASRNDSIILDKTAPVVNYFRIAGIEEPSGPTKTNSPTVSLYSDVIESGSGMYKMDILNYGNSSWNGFETYNSVRTGWEFRNSNVDELKRIYCRYEDKAGNVSSSVYDTITLDTTPPQDVTITINNGRTYAYDRTVQLSVSATDVPSGSEMRFYYDMGASYGYTSWENYGTSKTIQLEDLDGIKYVYVQFRDELDNTTTIDSATRDTIVLDRPSIEYVTKGKPGLKGKVQVFLNTVDKADGENVLYYVYTSPTSDGAVKTTCYYVSGSGGYVSVEEEVDHYFFIRVRHFYDGYWHYLDTYYNGVGGASRRGYAADVTVVYDDDDPTDTTLASTIKTVLQSANGGTAVSTRTWVNINKSVMLLPEDSVSYTYSAENTIHGDPVIITPSADAIRTYAGKMRNISAHGRGVIAMGNSSWSLIQSISNNFSSWGYTGQQPYSIGTGNTGTTDYEGPFYYRWNTTNNESPWKYPLYISTLGGENPTNNAATQITYYSPPTYPAWSISSKYISNDANPTGGEIYGRVYGSGNVHHFGIIRQGRFMIFAFDSMFKRTSGKVLFVNLVDKMNRNY